jgi:hypothetical protein
MTDKEF